MSQPIEIELISDDEPEEEGIVTADELFADLMEGFQHSQQWHDGIGTVRYTQFIDGQWIGPMEITKAEIDRLLCELAANEEQSNPGSVKQAEAA